MNYLNNLSEEVRAEVKAESKAETEVEARVGLQDRVEEVLPELELSVRP